MNQSQELQLNSTAAYRTINAPLPEKELNVKDVLGLLSRRRTFILSIASIFLLIAIVICVTSTRRYLATSQIQVQRESGSPLGLDSGASEGPSYTDAVQDDIALQTQVSILQSDSLALRVVRDLKLASTEDFKPKFSALGWVMGLISPDGPPDDKLAPANEMDMGLSVRERLHVLAVFSKNLKVKPIAGTRLIEISFLSPSPSIAAEVVNHLTQSLTDYNFETRHNTTARTAEYLTGQLSDLRKQSEALQAQVAKAQRDSGIVSLGGVDANGHGQVYSSVLDKLQQATTAYTQAQSNRIAKEAVYEAAKTGDPEAISSLGGSGAFATSGDGGLALIQSLRLQQATEKSELAELAAKFGTSYPKLAEMQQHLDTLTNSIKIEVNRMGERAKNDASMARRVEQDTRNVYSDLKSQSDALNDKTIAYTIMRQEADQSRTLYETLFKQLKEAGVLADFKVSNISVVDPARVPAKPAKPNVPIYLAVALAGGLFFGVCGALLRDMLDNKIASLAELESQLGSLPLGVLPFHSHQMQKRQPVRVQIPGGREKVPVLASGSSPEVITTQKLKVAALSDPRSAYIEAVRALRTSILLSRGGAPPQLILVTSSIASEGKSMLSINLATLLAQQGKKVLLVDGDFRRPTLHRTLNISNSEGLSSFLAGGSSTSDPLTIGVFLHDLPNLKVLVAGPVPPFPTELLGSEQMRQSIEVWRQHFDFVLLDGAPVLPVTDSVILSAMMDFTLLVARYGMTEKQSLERSYRLLQNQTERTKIGIVLNAVSRDSDTYYQYYGYKDSVYYGSDKKYA